MRTTTLLTVFCTAVLISCEPVSEPEVNVPDPTFAKVPVEARAFGASNVIRPDWVISPGGWRTFSFSAVRYEDGTATGRFEYNDQYMDLPNDVPDMGEVLVRGSGDVVCMTIEDNTVWVGGVMTEHSLPNRIGVKVGFSVTDNGEGANANPDLMTFIYPRVRPLRFCNREYDIRYVEVESGNFVVTGG